METANFLPEPLDGYVGPVLSLVLTGEHTMDGMTEGDRVLSRCMLGTTDRDDLSDLIRIAREKRLPIVIRTDVDPIP